MKDFIKWLKSLDKGTIVRTILQVLAYANQIVALIGRTSFASADWYQWVSLVVTFLITTVTWWFNNDITSAAQWGTKVLNAIEDGVLTEEEVKELLDNAYHDDD